MLAGSSIQLLCNQLHGCQPSLSSAKALFSCYIVTSSAFPPTSLKLQNNEQQYQRGSKKKESICSSPCIGAVVQQWQVHATFHCARNNCQIYVGQVQCYLGEIISEWLASYSKALKTQLLRGSTPPSFPGDPFWLFVFQLLDFTYCFDSGLFLDQKFCFFFSKKKKDFYWW